MSADESQAFHLYQMNDFSHFRWILVTSDTFCIGLSNKQINK